jgi:hypothetical protein
VCAALGLATEFIGLPSFFVFVFHFKKRKRIENHRIRACQEARLVQDAS